MNTGIEFAEKLSKAYSETCKPLCHELNIPQTAFDILLFLANNPEYKTARDIVEIRKIKANLVSVNVDKLVNEGYLERKSVEGDRRKVNLICTEKSKEIIQEGQKLQQSFVEKLFEGMDEDTRKALQKGMAHMEANIEKMLEMNTILMIIVTFFAGMGAGIGSGFAGMSAAAVISPILITFLGMDPYMAVGIALSSDVLASAVSAYTYGKNKNLDVKNGLIMMVSVLTFTVVGSYVSSLVPSTTMGNFSVFMTFLLGIKFIVKPVMTTKEAMEKVSPKKRAVQSLICGVMIGFICGFIGAGGGMMMLLILTSVLDYELKTAVGTSVFIMTFTAFTGAVSHFAIGGMPNIAVWILCIVFTLLWARIAAVFANKATPKTLNRATGVILVVLGIVVMAFSILN